MASPVGGAGKAKGRHLLPLQLGQLVEQPLGEAACVDDPAEVGELSRVGQLAGHLLGQQALLHQRQRPGRWVVVADDFLEKVAERQQLRAAEGGERAQQQGADRLGGTQGRASHRAVPGTALRPLPKAFQQQPCLAAAGRPANEMYFRHHRPIRKAPALPGRRNSQAGGPGYHQQ